MSKPHFNCPHLLTATLTGRTSRTFLVRRREHLMHWENGFSFTDRDGIEWRPDRNDFYSDGASIPHPLDWFFPCFDIYRFWRSTMGIHDPACRFKRLAYWDKATLQWITVPVPRAKADSLLQQAVQAEGGRRATRGAYWLGVRLGSGFR